MLRTLVLGLLCASCSAFVAGGRASAPNMRRAAAPAVPTTQMVLEPAAIDAATTLVADVLKIPIVEYSPAKAFVMMFSNILIISTMSIQGKSLARGTPHDEMVESFGITWLLAGTSLGHIVGAGAILGCHSAGLL